MEVIILNPKPNAGMIVSDTFLQPCHYVALGFHLCIVRELQTPNPISNPMSLLGLGLRVYNPGPYTLNPKPHALNPHEGWANFLLSLCNTLMGPEAVASACPT